MLDAQLVEAFPELGEALKSRPQRAQANTNGQTGGDQSGAQLQQENSTDVVKMDE